MTKSIKFFSLFILLIGSAILVKAQRPTAMEIADKHLVEAFDKMDYWWKYCYNDKKDKKVDSLRNSGGHIYDYIENLISRFPESLTAEFPNAKAKGLYYVTSEDRKLRIFSWPAKIEGHNEPKFEFRDVAGFIAEGGRKYHDISNGTEGGYCSAITTIRTRKDTVIYLANYYTIRNGMKEEKLKAYSLIDNTIKEISAFHEGTKNPKQLWCQYNVSPENVRTTAPVIHFNPEKTKIYMPVTETHGSQTVLTSKYMVFVFNGFSYVYDKDAK